MSAFRDFGMPMNLFHSFVLQQKQVLEQTNTMPMFDLTPMLDGICNSFDIRKPAINIVQILVQCQKINHWARHCNIYLVED